GGFVQCLANRGIGISRRSWIRAGQHVLEKIADRLRLGGLALRRNRTRLGMAALLLGAAQRAMGPKHSSAGADDSQNQHDDRGADPCDKTFVSPRELSQLINRARWMRRYRLIVQISPNISCHLGGRLIAA